MLRFNVVLSAGIALLATLLAAAQTVPVIVATAPKNGTTDVPPGNPVVMTFSVPMNKAVTSVRFYNSSALPPTLLTVTPSWNLEGTRLTNTPSPAFPAGKAISWLATGMDLQGNPLGMPFTGAFLTAAGGGPTPELVSVVPRNQATQVPTNTAVVFTFSVAMNTNVTAARFQELENPDASPSTLPTWNEAHTVLTCTPSPGFPAGRVILWTLQGTGAEGGAFPGDAGVFTTVGGSSGTAGATALISRGETAVQVDASEPPSDGQEFLALSDQSEAGRLSVVTPGYSTNLLSLFPVSVVAENLVSTTDTNAFLSFYPPGIYEYRVVSTNGTLGASIPLEDDPLPGAARLSPWMDPPRALLGEDLLLPWTFSNGAASIDHVRLEIRQGGRLLYASPLPGTPGALTGVSNQVSIPAATFTQAGSAVVSLSTFHITARETHAIPGLTLHAARHRTTRFTLRVVDGSTPPPALTSTRFPGIPLHQPVMYSFGATNGVRPLRFERISGSIPNGMTLGPDGSLTGTATTPGTFEAALLVTDLLGQAAVETVRFTTTPLPAFPTPRLENVRTSGSDLILVDLTGGAGVDCRVERSEDLHTWSPQFSTNPPLDRIVVQFPVSDKVGFFRVRGPGSPAPSNPIRVTPVPTPGVQASGEVGLFGGRLSLTNAAGWVFSLDIPAGALDRTETITLVDLARVDGQPFSGGLRAGVELRPAGVLFNTPVTLNITGSSAVDPAADIGFHTFSGGREFAMMPHFDADRTASFQLFYLATIGLARGTLADVQAQLAHAPDDPILALGQETAAIRFACALGNCDAIQIPSGNGPTLSSRRNLTQHGDPPGKNAVLDGYIRTAKQVIIPQLQTASESEDDASLDNALFAWFEWLKGLQLLGLASDPTGQDQEGELAACMQSAAGLAARGIWNGMTRSCQQCLEHDLSRIGRTESLARTAAMMGWSFDTYYFECAQRCLVFEVQIESLMISSGTSGTYLTDTKSKIELRPWDSDWFNILFGGGYQGQASWEVKNVEDFDTKCPITSAPKNGNANVPLARLTLFQKRCDYIQGQGLVVRNAYYPDLRIYLLANRDQMPKEGRTSRCPKEDPKDVANIFGPAFLAFHANTTETPEVIGEPCVRLEGFEEVGSGEVLFRKEYIQSQVVKDGYVEERTTVELVHKPQ